MFRRRRKRLSFRSLLKRRLARGRRRMRRVRRRSMYQRNGRIITP